MGNRSRRVAIVRVMKEPGSESSLLQSCSVWQKELVKYEEIDGTDEEENEQVISTPALSENPRQT